MKLTLFSFLLYSPPSFQLGAFVDVFSWICLVLRGFAVQLSHHLGSVWLLLCFCCSLVDDMLITLNCGVFEAVVHAPAFSLLMYRFLLTFVNFVLCVSGIDFAFILKVIFLRLIRV